MMLGIAQVLGIVFSCIFVIAFFVYYLVCFMRFIEGEYRNRKELFLSLIPFYLLVKTLKDEWDFLS